MKKYIELKQNNTATHLKVEVYYKLGGINYCTYKQEPRGYYLSVSPVTLERGPGYTMETYRAFSGVKQILKTVTRKSAKAEAEAKKTCRRIFGRYDFAHLRKIRSGGATR